jgi:trk system potassium uptake protein TrkA
MKSYLVIGAGRFGTGIVKELYRQHCEVIVTDRSEKNLESLDEYSTHAIVGDFRDPLVLDELKIDQFNAIFVAIGSDAFSAILITKKLKERKAKKIIAKANNREIGEILKSLGADRIILPEEEAGRKVARQELLTGVIEYIEITKDISAIEMQVPETMHGKSLNELNFSRKFDITVSLVLRNGQPILSHFADLPLQEGDDFLLIGSNSNIEKFKKKYK